jgi:hypothetical protein
MINGMVHRILAFHVLTCSALAQTTVSTGSIQGTVYDPTNAAVKDANKRNNSAAP